MDRENKISTGIGGGKNFEKQGSGDDGKKRTVAARAAEEQVEDINELADAFIKKFRNQLKIQRDESFKRFQEMIARGV